MDDLIPLYQKRLNLRDATFTRIEHEDAMVAIVYKITQSAGNPLILKVCVPARHYLRELYFLTHLAGKLPVPRILQVVEPEAGIHGAVLMECLPGTLLKITDFTDDLSFEMGAVLARIHLNRTEGYGDLIRQDELSSDPRIHVAEKFNEDFAECSDHLPKTLLDSCRHYFATHLDLLNSIDGPCITHRDFRPGNVMVHEGKLQGIIDWSSGRASFAEEDFVPMEHGEWSANPVSKKVFFAGYASIRPVPDYSAMMPLLRLSKAIAIVGCLVREDAWNSSGARLYQFNRRFLEAFLLG